MKMMRLVTRRILSRIGSVISARNLYVPTEDRGYTETSRTKSVVSTRMYWITPRRPTARSNERGIACRGDRMVLTLKIVFVNTGFRSRLMA